MIERVADRWRIVSLEDAQTETRKFEQWLKAIRVEADNGLLQEKGRVAKAQMETAIQGGNMDYYMKLRNVAAAGLQETLRLYTSLIKDQAQRLEKEIEAEPDASAKEILRRWLEPIRR